MCFFQGEKNEKGNMYFYFGKYFFVYITFPFGDADYYSRFSAGFL